MATATATPRNFDEAILEPLIPRAQLCSGNPTLANLLGVRQWPEVLEVANAWHAAHGLPGTPRVTDAAALAVVKLFAFPFFKSDVLKVAAYLPTTEKYQGKTHLAVMSEDVVSIALDELSKSSVSQAAVRERLRRAGALSDSTGEQASPTPIGALMGRVAAGGTE